MSRNILLTSLSAAESELPIRYLALRNEFGFDYCDVLLDAEASIKAVLARYAIDEVVIIGRSDAYGAKDDLAPFTLKHGSTLYSADKASISTFELLQYRMAQYAEELSLEQKAADACLPAETREKLAQFIQDFQSSDAKLKDVKPNRLFDALAQNNQIYERFRAGLREAFPELQDDSDDLEQWTKNYLYSTMKPSSKLELLDVNAGTVIRFLPENQIDKSAELVDSMMSIQESIVKGYDDINLYVSLNGDDAWDTYIVMNTLDILISMPKSGVHLKKIFTVRSPQRQLTGTISDDTSAFGVTELIHATRAFLNYGKVDMIVDIWEKSGTRNRSIASMVYAMRHVDVGLSMCNIQEMENGILRLRQLFRDEKLWREFGYYGVLFSVIAESIREDYGALLEGDGDIPFIDMVKWAYRHQFYQQTLTLIESKAPDMLVNSGIFFYCDDEAKKDGIIQLLAQKRLELKPYEYYMMDSIEHYFIKNYDRARSRNMGNRSGDGQRVYAIMRAQSTENTDPSLITGYTACDSTETLQNVLYAYYHTGTVRNQISHADEDAMTEKRLSVSESDESSALISMKDSIDFFINSFEKAMAEVQGKNPNVVLISPNEVRSAADQMKYDKRKDD